MKNRNQTPTHARLGTDRRAFLKDLTVYGGAFMVAGSLLPSTARAVNANNRQWRGQVGLELFTIGGLMRTPETYVATMETLSKMGIREIEPASGYAGMEPKEFRAMLDRLKMSMPSTHSGASGTGAALEKQLEGFQIMGMKYTEISGGGGGGGRGGLNIPEATTQQQTDIAALQTQTADLSTAVTTAQNDLSTASLKFPSSRQEIADKAAALAAAQTKLATARADWLMNNQKGANKLTAPQLAALLQQSGGPQPAAGRGGAGGGMTIEAAKRGADTLNANGKIAQKFGLKMLVHNHTGEFVKLEGTETTQHDIQVKYTDPALVAMQMDIGWCYCAGVDAIEMFKKNAGRYELWHVKDFTGLKNRTAAQGARPQGAQIVPLGTGEIDYKTVFTYADVAGMKHFCVEQDGARGMPDVQTSYDNLMGNILV